MLTTGTQSLHDLHTHTSYSLTASRAIGVLTNIADLALKTIIRLKFLKIGDSGLRKLKYSRIFEDAYKNLNRLKISNITGFGYENLNLLEFLKIILHTNI